MKRNRIFLVCLLTATFILTGFNTASAGQKSDMRVPYVLQNIGVKRDVQAKLKPLLVSYLADKKTANKQYDDMKKKLKTSIDNGTLTEKQAQTLLNLKWQADEKELVVKKDYEKKFKTVLPTKKVFLCFDLLNDSKSKMLGKNKENDDQDD